MKAPVLTSYGHIEWQERPLPKLNKTSVLIKIGYAGICGSDEHVFRGDFHPRTRLPFIQGHEFAGTIIDIGKNVKKVKKGDRVAVDPIFWCGKCAACEKGHFPACATLKLLGIDVDGGFGEYVVAGEFMLHKVPASISDRDAALVEVFSIGFHACNRSGIRQDDTAAIYGAGKIGQVILQAAMNRTRGRLFIVDVLEERLSLAKRACTRVETVNAAKEDPVEKIRALTRGRGVDIAFEAVGHAKALEGRNLPVRQCVLTIRQGGTVCVLGLSDEPVPLVMKELIWKEAKLVTSRVTHGEFKETIKMMRFGKINPSILVTDEYPASQAQKAFELLKNEPEKHMKILLKPGL
jgi:threonine dehydrogenase-like Zn-dependent dehydrogenase